MRAVVERNKRSELRACIEQSAFFGIFAYRVDVRAFGNARRDRAPAFSQVGRLKNIRFEIVEFMPIHGNIRGVSVMRRWIDETDRAPLRHLWCDLRPMLTVIGCHVNKSIICAGPQRPFL